MAAKRRLRPYSDNDLRDVKENPEWTREDFAKAKRGRDVLPAAVLGGVEAERRRRGRPPADAPKVPVTIRLDRDVVEAFKTTGKGWQTRVNATLARAVAAGRVDGITKKPRPAAKRAASRTTRQRNEKPARRATARGR